MLRPSFMRSASRASSVRGSPATRTTRGSTDAARSAQSDFSEMRRLTGQMLAAGNLASGGLRESYDESRSALTDDLEIAAVRAPSGEIRASVEAVGVAV